MPRRPTVEKREEWRQRLARYAQSNLTVTQFCLRERISACSFYQWRKRLKTDRPGTGPLPKPAAGFQTVQVVSPLDAAADRPTTIRVGPDLEIELGSDLDVVKAVLHQVLHGRNTTRHEGGASC
jgi:hypothetical protein